MAGGLEGIWVPLAIGADITACARHVDDWLAGWRNEPSAQGPAFTIVEADQDDLIGRIGLGDRGDGVVELVYGIAPDRRGRGYASAATRIVAEWLLSEGMARQVELRIDTELVISQRVAVRAGFVPAGTVMSHVPATGMTYEDLRYIVPA
jgi:RimJ/RimL family protein N-acetyltransferase